MEQRRDRRYPAMKVILAAASLLLFAAPIVHGQYAHPQGVEVLDAKNHPIHLKGTNLGNWMVPEGYMWRFEGGPQSPKEIEAYVTELVGQTRAGEFWKT